MNVRLLEPAGQELDEAIAYYNAQVGGLGDAFLLEALRIFGLVKQYRMASARRRNKALPFESVSLRHNLCSRAGRNTRHRRSAYAPPPRILA